MNSNSKEVKEQIRWHISQYYAPGELWDEIRNLISWKHTAYNTAYYMAECGDFNISYYDQRAFLTSLDLRNGNKEYTDEQVFKLYCHLIAREAQHIYNTVEKDYQNHMAHFSPKVK